MLKKFWQDRPPAPVCMAWATAGVLTAILALGFAWGVYRLVLAL